MEQITVPKETSKGIDNTKIGLEAWKKEVRAQIQSKLKNYTDEQIHRIIQNTFGDMNL